MSCEVNINSKLYKSILEQSPTIDSALRTYLALKRDGWKEEDVITDLPSIEDNTTYGKLLQAKVVRQNKAQEQLNKVNYNLKQAIKKGDNVKTLRDRKKFLESRILDLSKDIQQLEVASTIDGLESIFNSDSEFVNQLLQTNEIEDLDTAYAIINMYKQMGDFTDFTRTDHPLFDKDLLQILDPEGQEVKKLQQWSASMQLKESKLTQAFKDKVIEIVNNSNRYKDREKITYEELTQALKDVGFIDKNTIALGEEGISGGSSEVAKTIMDYILEDRAKATLAISKKSTQHKNLLEKAQNALKNLGYSGSNIYDVFKQIHKGKFTGRLASRFNQNFFEARKNANSKIYNNIDSAILSGDKDKIQKAYREKEKWKRENEILFDVRKLPEIQSLFPQGKQWYVNDSSHKEQLIEILGESGYMEQIEIQKNKIEVYLVEEEYKKEQLIEKYGSLDKAYDEFQIWQRVNSPFWASVYMYGDKTNLKYKDKFLNEYEIDQGRGLEKASYRGIEYLSSIPRKNKAIATWKDNRFEIKETNEALNYYDDNFAKIESNKDIYNYYKFITETLSDIRGTLPLDIQEKFDTIYDVPLYKKEFSEKMLVDGGLNPLSFGKLTGTSLYDKLIESLSDTEQSTVQKQVDEFGKEREDQSYSFVGNRREKVSATYNLKLLEYKQKHGKEADFEKKRNLKLEAEQEVSNQHSFDLGSIMEIYMYQATHAKFRQDTLPMLDLLRDTAKNIPKIKTNRWGKVVTDETENPLYDENPLRTNELEVIDNALKIHKGITTNKVEGASNTKVYTTEEKKELAKINKLLEGKLEPLERESLERQKDLLGSKVTGSGVVDTLLGYLRFLGLGWNISAMLPNAAAGYFANFIEASDGRIFSLEAMKRAYRLVPNSTLKLASLGKIQTDTAKKIATFISKSDVLLDSTNEFQKAQVNSKLTGKFEYLHPMNFNKWVEFPNQSTTAMARLMSIELEPGVTLWDIFDSDMNIKPEYDKYSEWEFEGEKFQSEIRKIKEVIKKIHGDYSEEGRLIAKNQAIGRMAFFFKTWVARTVFNRFGAETNSTDLGVQKGRYKSLTEGSASFTGAVVGTVFLPGIGTVIGGMGGWVAGKLYGRASEKKFTEDFFGTGMDLIRKLLRSKSGKYHDQFTEVDAANMRANIQELAFLLTMVGSYMIAKAALWDEDEPADEQIAHNLIVNQINRVTMDLAFFMNPQTPGDLVDQAIPISRIFTNASRVFTSGLKVMYGKELEANENTFQENLSKNLPGVLRTALFQESPINKAEYEKEMFPNLFWKYSLYGAN